MFLPRPCRRLDKVQCVDIRPPLSFRCYLEELGILNGHGMDDSKERLVAWENSSTSCKSIALQHSLAGVF